MFEITVLIISAAINFILGLLVYVKNLKSITNKYFFLLTLSFIVWSVVNYFSTHPIIFGQLWWIRLVIFFAAYLCLMVFLTFNVFPHYDVKPSRLRKVVVAITVAIMALTLTPIVFKGIKITHGSAHPIPNFGIGLFALLVVSLLGGGIYTVVKKYLKSEGKQKNQLKYIIFGISGTFILILITDFLLVVLFNNSQLVPLGPAYTLIFSGSFAYAIIKHKLFDIRAAAARAFTYLLSLGFIGGIYGVVVFLISNQVTITLSASKQRAIYIAFALITALFFQRVKRVFDRITNRIFFKDSYDPQLFIDKLNNILVRNIQLDVLLSKTEGLIERTLKTSYVSFIIVDNNQVRDDRFISSKNENVDTELISEIRKTLDKIASKVIIVDELIDQEHVHLSELLGRIDASVIVRLITHKLHIGYLIIGPKQSGDYYRSSDLELLDIISDEVSLAVQNALRFEEIQQFNVTLQGKVTEATKQLRKTNDKLRALDESKDEFISMASHQLRTPLTSVKGYVSMILDGDAGKVTANQKDLLHQAFISSQRMVDLIADLLNVSRLKTGKFVIEPKPTNLDELIKGEIDQLTEMAKSKNIELTYNKPKEFPVLMFDETKIRQVIMNFADNAIHYTPKDGHIKVDLENKPEVIEFRVVDDGIGVPRSEQHHLFTKFYRAGNARSARPDGTGLGLFMAKKVVVAEGGSIIFDSEEGKGSTFGFVFSKSKLAVPKGKIEVKEPEKQATPAK